MKGRIKQLALQAEKLADCGTGLVSLLRRSLRNFDHDDWGLIRNLKNSGRQNAKFDIKWVLCYNTCIESLNGEENGF